MVIKEAFSIMTELSEYPLSFDGRKLTCLENNQVCETITGENIVEYYWMWGEIALVWS